MAGLPEAGWLVAIPPILFSFDAFGACVLARGVLGYRIAYLVGAHPKAAGHAAHSYQPNTMRCLTSSEIHRWLTGQGMPHQPLVGGVPVAGNFPMPAERRARLQLASYLADLLAKDGNKLVEILPGPQRRPDEWEQISHFRAALDEARSAITAPGHLFKSGDRAHFRHMLAMLLGFETSWSFYIYSAPSHTTLLIHDGIEVWSAKKGVRNELARHLMPQRAA